MQVTILLDKDSFVIGDGCLLFVVRACFVPWCRGWSLMATTETYPKSRTAAPAPTSQPHFSPPACPHATAMTNMRKCAILAFRAGTHGFSHSTVEKQFERAPIKAAWDAQNPGGAPQTPVFSLKKGFCAKKGKKKRKRRERPSR